MNKYFSYIAALSLALTMTACSSEQDNIFDQSAAERLNSISSTYSTRLTDSKGGWVMEYYPYTDNEDLNTGVGYLIMNRYNTNGSVYTVMKNKASYNTKWEDTSAWQIITDMGPVLTYNTWNKCYGRFTDPVDIDLTPGSYSADESGKGYQGDYEFVMVDVPENGDHIMLKGKKRGIYQRMTRIPEGTDFETYLDDITTFWKTHFIDNAQWELLITDDGKSYRMNYADRGLSTVYPEGKDSTAYGWHMPFLVTKYNDQYHLRFKDSVMVEGKQMEQEYYFNAEEEVFHGMLNAENVIRCTPANEFIMKVFDNAHQWKTGVKMEKSSDFQTAMDNMVKELKSGPAKYTITQGSDKDQPFYFKKVDDQIQLSFEVSYTTGSTDNYVTLPFLFKFEPTDGGVSITYVEPRDKAATAILASFPTIKTFLESFNGTYTTTGKDNGWSLRDIKLTSTTKANSWIILRYEN